MSFKIGSIEAERLRQRIQQLKITQKYIAEQLDVSERYVRDILSTTKKNSIKISDEKLEILLCILGIGLDQVFNVSEDTSFIGLQKVEKLSSFIKHKTYKFLVKENPKISNTQEVAKFLQEDHAVDKAMGFWSILLTKTLSEKYPIINNFLMKNDFFQIIPKTGFWHKIRHDASINKNTYFSFIIKPTQPHNIFNIAYTIESPWTLGGVMPNKIKIIYGKIEQNEDHIHMQRYNDTPASYRIPYSKDILVTIWLDGADHDFIITSANDFKLITDAEALGYRSKEQVRDSFHKLETIVFPRHHLFHRNGKQDMSDDPWLFWDNHHFTEFNKDLYDYL